MAGEQPAEFPDAYYRQAAARGQPVYEVDPASSLVVIEVRRGGTLAQLGHDHVVASHDVRGYLAPADGRADLYLRLDRLVVDERDLRAEAQFDTQPSDEAIAGTRANMLDKLGAGAHPWALVAVRDVAIDASGSRMNATLTLNGSTRAMDAVPADRSRRREVERGRPRRASSRRTSASRLSPSSAAPFRCRTGCVRCAFASAPGGCRVPRATNRELTPGA